MKKKFLTIMAFAALLSVSTAAQETPQQQNAENQQQEEQLGTPPEEPELSDTQKLEKRTSELEGEVKKLKKLTVGGYIQTQYQYGQEAATLKSGDGKNETASTDDAKGFGRFGIRRGRLKVGYDSGLASGTFEVDITEGGIKTKNAFINVKDPWIGTCALQAGVFDRPFGYEINYSSSKLESPERSMFCNDLFPDERDLGAMLVLAPQKNSTFDFLKFKGGLFAGNAINKDTKTLRDFIGTLTAQKNIGSDGQWELGASLYEGGVFQGSKNVYTMSGNAFKCDSTASNYGDYAKREYIGFDGNIAYEMPFGMTKLTAEYVFGKQPATSSSTKSPNASSNPSGDTYIRNFSGYYIMLVQDLGASPFSLVAKYDFYDPNTDIKGDNVGKNKTSKADLNKTTIGLGAIWRASNSLKFTAFYDINKNEKTANVKGYDKDLKDNAFTLRMQYNF